MSTGLPTTFIDSSARPRASLARYREPTVSAYRRDLRCFWQWCADHKLEPLAVRRPHLESRPTSGRRSSAHPMISRR